MKCRHCREPIRRVQPGEGYDPREYEWTHESGGVLCGLEPPCAEPELCGFLMGGVMAFCEKPGGHDDPHLVSVPPLRPAT